MSPLKVTRAFLLAAFGLVVGLATAERFAGSDHYSIVSVAKATVGRPLTPVSVAGVARRQARRS